MHLFGGVQCTWISLKFTVESIYASNAFYNIRFKIILSDFQCLFVWASWIFYKEKCVLFVDCFFFKCIHQDYSMLFNKLNVTSSRMEKNSAHLLWQWGHKILLTGHTFDEQPNHKIFIQHGYFQF